MRENEGKIRTRITPNTDTFAQYYMNLSIITGGENRPDMIVTQSDSTIFALKSSLGFENNIDLKTKWKAN